MPTQQIRAIWHPARARIYDLLTRGPATEVELIKAAGGPRARVAYHSRVLCRAGCIRRSDRAHPDSGEPTFEVV